MSRVALLTLVVLASFNVINALPIYGLTANNSLIFFDTATPGTIVSTTPLTGLLAGENIIGIDFRPRTNEMFAVSSMGNVYIVHLASGTLYKRVAIPTALNGGLFGVDFHPVMDRIRIVSNSSQNIRVNPDTGVVTPDPALNGNTTAAVSAAYTQNFLGTSTVPALYVINDITDTLYIQKEAAPGVGGETFVGFLGVDVGPNVGFDITTLWNSTTNTAFASFYVGGVYGLYTITLNNGSATFVGAISNGITTVLDIAIPICASVTVGVCEPYYSLPVYGLTTTNTLVRFLSSDTSAILSTVTLAPLAMGENLLNIDFRPATGVLYTISNLNNLYTVNLQTGALTYINRTSVALNGTSFGFDFNPVADRIRIVSDFGQNLRVVPDSGVVMPDLDINGATGISSAAYANNVPAAASTTLYTLSATTLYTQNPPNNGTEIAVGNLNVMTNITTGFDIATNGSVNYAGMSAPIAGVFRFLTVNLATGEAIIRGIIGQTPINIIDIAFPILTPIAPQQSTQNAGTTQQTTPNPTSQTTPIQTTAPINSASKNSFLFVCLMVIMWLV